MERLPWREQPLAALTDGMMQSPYHGSATGHEHGQLWHEQAQGLPDASRLPRAGAPHRVAGHVLWSNRDDAGRQISTTLGDGLSTLDKGMLRRNRAS
jgi:hypothetical protein